MRTLAILACVGVFALAPLRAADRQFSRLIVGQWQGPHHVRVFYGDGNFFIDPEPEGRPLGRWRVDGDRLWIRAPRAQSEIAERILKLTRSRMTVVAADGRKYVYRRVEQY